MKHLKHCCFQFLVRISGKIIALSFALCYMCHSILTTTCIFHTNWWQCFRYYTVKPHDMSWHYNSQIFYLSSQKKFKLNLLYLNQKLPYKLFAGSIWSKNIKLTILTVYCSEYSIAIYHVVLPQLSQPIKSFYFTINMLL